MVLRLDDVVRAGGVGGQFCSRLARGEFADGGCGKENRHRPPCVRFRILRRRRRAGRSVGRCDDADPLRFVFTVERRRQNDTAMCYADMADKESYRRLKVWARWCQAQNAGHPLLIQQGDSRLVLYKLNPI